MKARLLQLVTVMLIGVALAGCAGTGAKFASSSQNPQEAQGPWPRSASDFEHANSRRY